MNTGSWNELVLDGWCRCCCGGGGGDAIRIILTMPAPIDPKVNLSGKGWKWASMSPGKCLVLTTSPLASKGGTWELSMLTEPSHVIVIITGAGRGGNN